MTICSPPREIFSCDLALANAVEQVFAQRRGKARPLVPRGKVRAVAVTSSKRNGYAPDILTMRESGIDGYEEAGRDLWFGVLAPAGTPKAIVDRLNAELVKALKTPEVSERIRARAYDVWTLYPRSS